MWHAGGAESDGMGGKISMRRWLTADAIHGLWHGEVAPIGLSGLHVACWRRKIQALGWEDPCVGGCQLPPRLTEGALAAMCLLLGRCPPRLTSRGAGGSFVLSVHIRVYDEMYRSYYSS